MCRGLRVGEGTIEHMTHLIFKSAISMQSLVGVIRQDKQQKIQLSTFPACLVQCKGISKRPRQRPMRSGSLGLLQCPGGRRARGTAARRLLGSCLALSVLQLPHWHGLYSGTAFVSEDAACAGPSTCALRCLTGAPAAHTGSARGSTCSVH